MGASAFFTGLERRNGLLMNMKMLKEKLIKAGLFVCAAFSIVFVLSIIFYSLYNGNQAITAEFLHGFYWVPCIYFTVYVAVGAVALAVAIGLPCAIYMAEFADMRLRNVTKTSLEVLDGFPSIVIGVLGWELLSNPRSSYSFTHFLHHEFGMIGTGCLLFGWLILMVMSFPVIATISEDALRAVSQDLREASLGVGATKWQTTTKVLLPSAMPRVLASILLALAAAMGEVVALWWVLGFTIPPVFSFSPLSAATSLSMIINNQFQEANESGSPFLRQQVFAAAFVLFIVIGLVNIAIRIIVANQSKRGAE